MSKLKERYLAKRQANVIIQDAPPIIKKSVWELIGDGIECAHDQYEEIYYDALDSMVTVRDLLEDVGINPDRSYSVSEVTAIRDAIATITGGRS